MDGEGKQANSATKLETSTCESEWYKKNARYITEGTTI